MYTDQLSRPRKIAVFSPYATSVPHYETEMEIIQRHLDAGDQVEMIACQGALPCCAFNMTKSPAICESCVGRRNAGLLLINPRIKTRKLGDQPAKRSNSRTEFHSIEELVAYRIDNFEIGYAVLSSLVSQTRDPQPSLVEHASTIAKLIATAITVYDETIDYCRKFRPDCVYNFNGRFASMRAVLRACQTCGVDCFMHERGCDIHHFELYENSLPHDIEYIQNEIRNAWATAGNNEQRKKIGNSWFEDRFNRVERNWRSFVKEQSQGSLPGNWNDSRKNISIFTTSEDEFVAIGDSWKNKIYKNQAEAVARIARDLQNEGDSVHLYVRMHPNLGDVDNVSTREILALKSNNISVLAPNDPVDSYELMNACDSTVTFGSSMGIEAAFWRHPSILLGPCFYQGFDCVYQPDSHFEAIELIKTDLNALPNDSAIMYGYWFQTHGFKFKYFEATGFFEGKFKGESVYPRKKHRLGRRIEQRVRKLRNFVIGRH